jgi:hypothetical protein
VHLNKERKVMSVSVNTNEVTPKERYRSKERKFIVFMLVLLIIAMVRNHASVKMLLRVILAYAVFTGFYYYFEF